MSSPTLATTGMPSWFGNPHADVVTLAKIPADLTFIPISWGRVMPARGRRLRFRGLVIGRGRLGSGRRRYAPKYRCSQSSALERPARQRAYGSVYEGLDRRGWPGFISKCVDIMEGNFW